MDRQIGLLVSAVLCSGVVSFGAMITASLSCISGGQIQTVSSVGGCDAFSGGPDFAQADASAGLMGVQVDARTVGSGMATAAIAETFLVSSAGPVQSGWLYVDSMRIRQFFSGNSYADAGVITPYFSLGTGSSSDNISFFVPVTLGTPFEIQLYADAGATGDPNGSAYVTSSSSLTLQFYEGDFPNLTPVAAYIDVPEPALALWGLGIGLAGVLIHRKRLIKQAGTGPRPCIGGRRRSSSQPSF